MATQEEVIKAIARKTGKSQADVKAVLEGLGCIGVSILNANGDVPLPHIGKLHTQARAARRGRNPRTGAPMDIPGRRVLRISPTQALRATIA